LFLSVFVTILVSSPLENSAHILSTA